MRRCDCLRQVNLPNASSNAQHCINRIGGGVVVKNVATRQNRLDLGPVANRLLGRVIHDVQCAALHRSKAALHSSSLNPERGKVIRCLRSGLRKAARKKSRF